MHFYTYDEWRANSYYSKDDREIRKGSTKVYKLKDNSKYLHIRSCWKNPKFVSTYPGEPISVPTMHPIDCNIGCLYQTHLSFPDPYTKFRQNRGCIQSLSGEYGASSISESPYIMLDPDVYYDKFQDEYKELLTVNIESGITELDRILIFQSIYSGAIAFQDMNSNIELYFSIDSTDDTKHQDYDYFINTTQCSSDSLMMAALMLTFDTVGTNNKYLIIENMSEFVYGHVDMDNRFDWNILWETYKPPINSHYMESSIMHYEKG